MGKVVDLKKSRAFSFGNIISELCKKVTLNVKMLENTAFYVLR